MNGRWRVRRRARRRCGVGRHGSFCAAASGRRRSGTAPCSRWATVAFARSGPISSRLRRGSPRSSPGSAAATSRGSSARRSSTSGSSPGSGTCGSPRRSGTGASRRGRVSLSVSDDDLRAHARLGAHAMRRSGGRTAPNAGRLSPCGSRLPALRHAVRSRGLGDANRTAYWCPSVQPQAISGEGGIRTLDERITTRNALAGRRLQPLGHLSRVAQDIGRSGRLPKPALRGRGYPILPRRGAGAVERGGLENR